mgnify:FL=1
MAVSNLRLGGITSGFDTEAMVTQLLSSYQTRIDKQSQKITKLSWQQSAYQDITKKITEFKNTYFDVLKRDTYLMSPSTFNKFKADVTATSNADAAGLTVSTTSNSSSGSYKIKLNQAAKASTAQGNSITSGNFKLDLDKALSSASGEVKTNDDGSKTWTMNFALDVQVGGIRKTISFSADALLGADGNVADKDAAKSSIIDSLNQKLQESFGYSGKTSGATGATDANGKEWFLQVKLGSDGKAEFQVGGNASVSVAENKGNFGLAQPKEKVAISTGSVVTGVNAFQVEIGGKNVSVAFNGVSSTYYDSKGQTGNEAILAEYKELKTAAYRKSYNLADNEIVSDEQLEKFIREHPDTRLIIIDTLQKIREVSTDAYSYANDYDIVGRMKQFADKNGVCLLLVHHTRKQQAGDKFEMISGTTGLLGCADGAFLLQKEMRTDLNATLEIVGRDQPDQKLHLTRDAEKLTWQLNHAETELWKKPPDPLLSKLAAVIARDTPVWNGSATELVALLGEDIQPNILTRRLNVKAGELLNEYSIEYTVKRTRSGSFISLARKAV